jgi:hypothetical protein
MLKTILKRWRAEGVKFVTLDEALKDPVNKIDPNRTFDAGRTFLEQVARDEDVDAFKDARYSVPSLNAMCTQPIAARASVSRK